MTLKTYDLYGIKCDGLDVARELIEKRLNITMVKHESGFHCGEYYRLSDVGHEHFILQNNYDYFEGEWTEDLFSEYPVLFYINETNRPNDLESLLLADKHLTLLRHQEL